jgi:hypothetical protein
MYRTLPLIDNADWTNDVVAELSHSHTRGLIVEGKLKNAGRQQTSNPTPESHLSRRLFTKSRRYTVGMPRHQRLDRNYEPEALLPLLACNRLTKLTCL